MRSRELGRTGIRISEIGFGGWGIGGATPGATSYGETDDRQSLEALAEAVRLGISFFDTSPVYGNGHSERLIGQALKGQGDKAAVCTKAGCADYAAPLDFSPAAIERSVAGSIERLQRPIDLLLLHNPDPADASLEASLACLGKLKQSGRIRAFGISLRSPADGDIVLQRFPAIAAIEVNLNLLDQRAERSGLLDRALHRGVGVIARTPLAFGFLSGRLDGTEAFPASDHRSRWPREQLLKWADGGAMFVERFAEPGQTPVDFALRYCLSCPAVASVIPGISTPLEARQNAKASEFGPLSAEVMRGIAQLYDANDFFVTPPKPNVALASKE